MALALWFGHTELEAQWHGYKIIQVVWKALQEEVILELYQRHISVLNQAITVQN